MEKKISWPMISVAGGGLVIGLWGLSSIVSTVGGVVSPRQPPVAVQAFAQPAPQVNVYVNTVPDAPRPVVVTRPRFLEQVTPMVRPPEQDVSLPPPLRLMPPRQAPQLQPPPPLRLIHKAAYGSAPAPQGQGVWVEVGPHETGIPPTGEPNSVFQWHGYTCKQPWYDVYHGPTFWKRVPKCWRLKNIDEED
jgi:hypothetical protein